MGLMFGIEYHKNDGSGTSIPVTGSSKCLVDDITAVGQNWGETPVDWSRTGYTFLHWNTASDDSGTSYVSGDLYTGTMISLHAIWQEEVQTPDVSISLGITEIATLSDTGSVTLATDGTYLTDDITIQYTKSGGGGGATTVTFDDDAIFGSDKVIYVDGDGTVQIVAGLLASYSACTYQMLQGGSIVLLADSFSGGLFYTGTFSGITYVTSGTMTIRASKGTGTLLWAVFQVN